MQELDVLLKRSPPINQKYILVYILSSLALIVYSIVSVSMNQWYTYCFWDFGLVKAETILHNSPYKNEDTISDVRVDNCYGLKDTIERECPDFCDFPTRFEFAGAFILICTVISVIIQIFTSFYHFLRYKRRDFKKDNMMCLMIVIFILQFIGFIGYYFMAGFVSLKDVTTDQIGAYDANSFEWKAGMGMYISLFILQFGLMIFGLLFTRKGFS